MLAALAGAPARALDVRAQAGDIKDARTTGKAFAGLEIELRLVGDDLDGVRGVRCVVTKAVDDTGRDLLRDDSSHGDFVAPDRDNPNQTQLTLQLKNPTRRAATVAEISGTLEVFKPQLDPACVVPVSGFVGQPRIVVSHPSGEHLPAAG